MTDITVLIYTKKNDPNIDDCLASAKLLTDKIILVYPDSSIVETVREKGIKQAKTDWVFILDADERITNELAKEIKDIIRLNEIKSDEISKKNTNYISQYKIPRRNIFAGTKWLRHGGWWPDYQIRLINKKYFIRWPKRIHSTPEIKGKFGFLKNPIIHFFHGDIEKMVEKTIVFENIESDLLYQAGKKANTFTFFRKFIAELWRRLIKKFGFLDGEVGIIESIYQAFSKTITYLFLYEKNHQSRSI